MIIEEIKTKLFEMQDLKYKDFQSKLLPNVDPNTVIGVRIPQLRHYAKEIQNHPNLDVFLHDLPHQYYEENNLHAFLIEQIKDFDSCIAALDAFLPYIDNWATCDSLRPKCFPKNREQLLPKIEQWISNSHCYTIRYGIEALMLYFLDDHFDLAYLERVSRIQSDEYYVNMMIAWYFATALTKQYDRTICYLTDRKLSVWVHNKTIQKAIESHCVSQDKKVFFKTLKR